MKNHGDVDVCGDDGVCDDAGDGAVDGERISFDVSARVNLILSYLLIEIIGSVHDRLALTSKNHSSTDWRINLAS